MEESGAGRILFRRGVPEDWGEPVEAVAWFDDDNLGTLKVLVADYANGRRVELHIRKRDYSITFKATTP